MNEIEIALGTVFAAHQMLHLACKREQVLIESSVEGSRHRTFAGVNSRELNQAYSQIESASRLICSARDRQARLDEQSNG